MGDLHVVVVHNRGQVIGGEAVALEQHVVVEQGVLEGDFAAQLVVDDGLALRRHGEADDVLDAGADAESAAAALSAARPLGLLPRFAQRVQALRGAVAAVGLALVEQPIGRLDVERQPLGLAVGAVRPADVGAFIPVQTEPAQRVEDQFFGSLDGAGLVGVLDADDELSAEASGEQPVEEGGADVADVRLAGWRGSVANADGHSFASWVGSLAENFSAGGKIGLKSSVLLEIVRFGWSVLVNFGVVLAVEWPFWGRNGSFRAGPGR